MREVSQPDFSRISAADLARWDRFFFKKHLYVLELFQTGFQSSNEEDFHARKTYQKSTCVIKLFNIWKSLRP